MAYCVFHRPVCKIPFRLPPYLKNHNRYWLEILTSDRYWWYKRTCQTLSRLLVWLVFYRPVSILSRLLIFWTTTGRIYLKFCMCAYFIKLYHWSNFQAHTICHSGDMDFHMCILQTGPLNTQKWRNCQKYHSEWFFDKNQCFW